MRAVRFRYALAASLVLPLASGVAPLARSTAHAVQDVPLNIRVSHGRYQDYGEPSLAVNPRDPRNLLGASQCFNGPALPRPCTFVSFDSGRTWRDNGPLALPTGDAGGGDVTVAFDPHGRGFVASHAGAGWNVDTVLVWWTDDGGRAFARPVVVFPGSHGTTVVDHPSLTVDAAGILDVAWTATVHGDVFQTRLLFSQSLDGGRHFTAPRSLALVPHGYPAIPVVTVGPAHAVHVFYAAGRAPDPYARPYTPMQRLVLSSPDGGRHFAPPRRIATAPGFGIVVAGLNMANIQAATTDPRDGALYAAMIAYRPHSRQTTVLLYHSHDGVTWVGPVRVDGEPGADGADHTQPQLAVTPGGTVYVSYFAWSHGHVAVYLAVSRTRGVTFDASERITSVSFNPALSGQQREGAPWIGDYQGLAVGAGSIFPFWNDTRTGHLQLFTAAVPTVCC